MKNIEYITAGAGSGKTYTLTKKLANQIISNKLKPDQVILTTFTKAAADEFKIKAANELCANGLQSAAQQLQGAMIGTIDSVSQSFVQKYWYLLGMSPELNVMGDGEMKFYQISSLVNSQLITPAVQKVFNKVRHAFDIDEYDFWKDDLLRIINLSRTYGIGSLKKSIEESYKLIDLMFDNPNHVDWKFVHNPSNAKYAKVKVPVPGTKKTIDKIVGNGIFSLKSKADVFDTLLEASNVVGEYKFFYDGTSLFDVNGNPSNGRVGAAILDQSILGYSAQCKTYLESKYWGDILKLYVDTICQIATSWHSQYSQYKTNHHLVDFNDIELKFKDLLSNPEVKNDIKNQYRLVMVDEFQDCNPLQVEIFGILSELVDQHPQGGTSIWVGDEKQSIYGFRGSNMEFIKAVIAQFPPSKRGPDSNGLMQDTLEYSFRSRKKLVEKSNDMVMKMFGSGTLKPVREVNGEDDLDYALNASTPAIYNWHSVQPNRGAFYADLAAQVKALLDHAESPQNFIKDYQPKQVTKESVDVIVEDETTQEIARGVKAGDIAILTRSNANVSGIVNALNEVGIRVNAVEGDIKSMAEIQLLMAILNYSLQKSEYSKAQILYLWDNKKVEDIISDKISNINWNSNAILVKIDDVLSESKGLSVLQLIETLLLRLDIWNHVAKWGNVSRRHANINTFLKIAAGYEEHTRLLDLACSVMGFINYFDSENVSVETPFVKDPEAVSVITYHKSKGLEWPIVILDSLYDDILNEQTLISREFFGVHSFATNPNAITCAGRDEYLIIFPKVVSGKTNLPDALKKKISSRVSSGGDIYERVKAERARLLYVGFTRARDYVMTLSYGKGEFTMLDYYNVKEIIVDDTNSGDVIFKTDIPTVASTATAAATYDEITNTPVNTGSDINPRYVSPSKLDHKQGAVTARTPVVVRNPISLSVGNVPMSDIGTCIHDIYAVYDDNMPIPNMVAKADQICDMHNRGDIKPNSVDFVDAIKELYVYLTKTYDRYSAVYHELPVMHKLANGQIMNGEIDLLWCLSDKEAIIVDFKSMKDDDAVATDVELMTKGDGYAAQICAYEDAVKKSGINVKAKILFFPLQGKIVELK